MQQVILNALKQNCAPAAELADALVRDSAPATRHEHSTAAHEPACADAQQPARWRAPSEMWRQDHLTCSASLADVSGDRNPQPVAAEQPRPHAHASRVAREASAVDLHDVYASGRAGFAQRKQAQQMARMHPERSEHKERHDVQRQHTVQPVSEQHRPSARNSSKDGGGVSAPPLAHSSAPLVSAHNSHSSASAQHHERASAGSLAQAHRCTRGADAINAQRKLARYISTAASRGNRGSGAAGQVATGVRADVVPTLCSTAAFGHDIQDLFQRFANAVPLPRAQEHKTAAETGPNQPPGSAGPRMRDDTCTPELWPQHLRQRAARPADRDEQARSQLPGAQSGGQNTDWLQVTDAMQAGLQVLLELQVQLSSGSNSAVVCRTIQLHVQALMCQLTERAVAGHNCSQMVLKLLCAQKLLPLLRQPQAPAGQQGASADAAADTAFASAAYDVNTHTLAAQQRQHSSDATEHSLEAPKKRHRLH